MPQMNDITVKMADGTTDITYVARTPSAGDSVPARWSRTSTTTMAATPTIEMQSRFNGPRTTRQCTVRGSFPIMRTNAATTFEERVGVVPVQCNIALPLNIQQADIDMVVEEFSNLLRSSLIRDSLKSGYAPT